MAAKKCGASSGGADDSPRRRTVSRRCGLKTRDRNQHYAESAARRARILNIAAWLAVVVSVSFVVVQIVIGTWLWQVVSVNVAPR